MKGSSRTFGPEDMKRLPDSELQRIINGAGVGEEPAFARAELAARNRGVKTIQLAVAV